MTTGTVKSAVEPNVAYPLTWLWNALTARNAIDTTNQTTATQNENAAAYNDLNQSQRDLDMWARVAEGRNNQGTPMPMQSPDALAPLATQPIENQPSPGLTGGAPQSTPIPPPPQDPGMMAQLGQFAATPGGGAALGAGAGSLYGLLSGRRDEEDRRSWLQRVLTPAIIGGGLGAAAGYGMNQLNAGGAMNEGAKAASVEPTDEELGAAFEDGFNQFLKQANLSPEAEAQVRQVFEHADIESIQTLNEAYRQHLDTIR